MGAVLFLAAAAFVLYTLFGYPLLVALLARLRPRPVAKEFLPRTVTVLLPVWNGEEYLAAKLDSLLGLDYPPELLDILVLSDGSTDGTAAIAHRYAARGVSLLELPRGGKAAALNAGLAEATGEILFLTDVRQELEPDSLQLLLASFADPAVGVVSGELIIRDGETREEQSSGLYWKYEKWLRKRLALIDSVLGATGCIYAMRRALAKPLPVGCLLDDMYLPLQVFRQGYRVVFEERARAYDEPAPMNSEFRRKVRTLAGNYQLIGYLPWLITPGNRMLLHYLSHKVARLLLPFALLTMLLASPWLPAPWNWVCFVGQLSLYGLALADRLVPDGFPLKRLSSPAWTFTVLMAASFWSASILFRPRADFWGRTQVKSPSRPTTRPD
jgi:biofilm PGA synthesis N-glycosyltransferase PgaC